MNRNILLVLVALCISGCTEKSPSTVAHGDSASVSTSAAKRDNPPPSTASAQVKATVGNWGVDLNAMKASTPPGDDFNAFVNGKWIEKFDIPADRATYGAFHQLRERSTEQVHAILKRLADSNPTAGSLEQKVGDYYRTWMDQEAINKAGITAVQEHLKAISSITKRADLARHMASLHLSAPFEIGIIPDPADTTRYTAYLAQAGLGMPDRDYYLKDDQRFEEFRAAYRAYLIQLHKLAGIDDATSRTDNIIALEKRMAESHWTKAESRDIKKIYNPMAVGDVQNLAPQLPWAEILETMGLASEDNIVVIQPSAIEAAGELFSDVPVSTWKDYLRIHLISDNAPYLGNDFDHANFTFFKQTLKGTEQQRERWKRGADLVNENLGEAVGKLYVAQHFSPSAKAAMEELVGNLSMALKERLETNTWMDDQTRAAALAKLETFESRIGYPSKWTDYTDLEITDGDMLGNAMRLVEFHWKQQVDRLNQPVDRALWPYPPQTVNASYNPLLNQITFPAGILQPPFFDLAADPAVNYGAIGMVIGHEIGHGFDDQGRRFDEQGRIRDWWTEAADSAFKHRSQKLVEQYNAFSPLEGMNIDGQLTLGENIGDLGGLEIAYSAYRRHVSEHGAPPVRDGFTGDQRFFLAFAQAFRAKQREDHLRQQLVTDPHSPAEYRVNGVVRNVDAWYAAFDVEEDDALYLSPDDRVRIW
ncbi:M13 family metallopeptidase [Microbulbifer yueqingensis]|uniref:Endothelin-converting enzyme/putative endopeptidase n=1 Tax=Microbulbifer yueqingensis TaxID=658219 RepID=A0A1G9ATZ5_9GAMM|nr:M13 family metallopeptidase [Microbulbifer yueqingensis]SDK30751.1 endothelin-converting enzyme/putative endopeptidase [Microbulbifer yueqingensis]